MTEFWVVCCGGFRGCAEYATEQEAREAAELRSNITGWKWEPKKLIRVSPDWRGEK